MNIHTYLIRTAIMLGTIFISSPDISYTADAVSVAGGDLQVDGLWFSGDTNRTVIRKPSDFPFPWTISGQDIYYSGGNVGIGVLAPAERLDIFGNASVSGSVTAATLTSSAPTGTPPLTVSSTTLVPNLNAGMVGGKNLADLDARYAPATSTAIPAQVPGSNTITTIDNVGFVMQGPSITIGIDGLPIIAYKDELNGDLKVAKCSTPTCASGTVITTIDSTGNVGSYSSIAIRADGLPVISYFDGTTFSLKFAVCGNMSCSSGTTIRTLDSSASVGQFTSLAVNTDGMPIVSYYDTTNQDLKVVKCGSTSCSNLLPFLTNLVNTVDSTGNVGRDTSLAIGIDGLPIIAYHDATNTDFKIAKCGTASCASGNTITTVDSAGIVGYNAVSLSIGSDGLPVAAYYDATNQNLKVLKCGNNACSSGNAIAVVDGPGSVGYYSSMTIGTDGLPIIAYWENGVADLKIAKCGNSACSAGNVITTVDSTGQVGYYPSITIGADGLPIVAYLDDTNSTLKVLKCANQFCINRWSRR